MKRILTSLIYLVFLFFSATSFSSNNYLTGIGHEQVTVSLTPNSAAMGAVEAGPRNYRASGTWGWALNPCNRVKLTGEWLWQDIDYNFITGSTREWVSQTALGIGYQYILNNQSIFNSIDLTGYYSHAPGKSLIPVDFRNVDGTISSEMRHIAGSNATGISPSVNFRPWQNAYASVGINWDDVRYSTKNVSSVTARGFGGTASLKQAVQAFGENFEIGGSAGVRKPFNNYHAEVDWIKPFPTSQLLIGFFGNLTQGKKNLPKTSLLGINVSYAIDTTTVRSQPVSTGSDTLVTYVSQPAVYMPQVLAIADGGINVCAPGTEPAFRGQIPNLQLTALPFDASKLFTGNSLTFSAINLGSNTINPATGIISGTSPATGIIVTASGPCGPKVASNSFAIS